VEVYDSTTPTDLPERVKDAEVLVLNKVKITDEIFDIASNLKLICITATGYDNVDIASAKKHGVAVCNVPGYSTDSVALITLATVLSLVTHLTEYNRFVTDGSYTASGVPNRLTPVYHEVRGLKWGIIGYGNIGRAVAEVARALGADILVNKRTPIDGVRCVDIDTLCKESDIITIHCPLNEQSRGLISAEKISLMKKNVIIVNEARGAVVCDEDVVKAIEEGLIGGFGSDVYPIEPLEANHPFVKIMHRDNVILTPHCAWGAYESRARCLAIVCDNIRKFYNGEFQNRVDIM
jgi:glycerate dehydrogenase